jgi:hypothetical protein
MFSARIWEVTLLFIHTIAQVFIILATRSSVVARVSISVADREILLRQTLIMTPMIHPFGPHPLMYDGLGPANPGHWVENSINYR